MDSVLIVTTPATSPDLTTVAAVKTMLGIEGTEDDAFLASMVTACSQAMSAYCGRTLIKEVVQEQTEFGSPSGEVRPLVLRRWPLISVASVQLNGETKPAGEYLVDKVTGMIWLVDGSGYRLDWGNGSRVVTAYTAGWTQAPDTTNPIPSDISLAAMEYVKQVYNDRDRADNLKSERILDVYAVSYFDGAAGMPRTVVQALDRYRSWA